jgi:uncharacterized membrane protein YdjX (TVP38/TMEM64 family)
MKEPANEVGQRRHSTWLRPGLALAGVIALLVVGWAVDAPARLGEALEWVQQLGWVGVGVFMALYVLACVLFLPGAILTLGAGVVFGLVKGAVIVSAASTLGAAVAFLIGRYLARDWVSGKLAGNAKFRAIDEAIGREGWRIVGLARLSPIFPFNLLNYAFGATRIALGQYVLASWIGMMPGTLMYVYLGSLAGNLAALSRGAGGQPRTPAQWTLYAVGLLATVAVTVYVTRIARRALNQRIAVGR